MSQPSPNADEPAPKPVEPALPSAASPAPREVVYTPFWALAGQNPWVVCIVPLLVFMVVGLFEPPAPLPWAERIAVAAVRGGLRGADPAPTKTPLASGESEILGAGRSYPLVYALKIALTMLAMGMAWSSYRRYPLRVHWLAVMVGLLGGAAWIALALGQARVQQQLGWGWGLHARQAFNPLIEMRDTPLLSFAFLALRLFGLVVIVPIIEEFFLRGFVMRYCVAPEWWNVPIGVVNRTAIVAGTLIPLLMHPAGEALAVLVWFSAMTWLLIKTRSLGSCIVAHALTNLCLGLFAITTGNWTLL